MATKQFNSRIKWKRDTSANWTSNNPVLLDGEIIIVDTNANEVRFKVGDGTSRYTALPFQDEFLQSSIDDVESALNSHTGNTSNPHKVTKSQVGLENVDNVKQYSANNPPPYPVSSVNGKTGTVSLDAEDVDALPISGGTLTGALTLHEAPTSTNQAATKGYVDTQISNIDLPESVQTYSGSLPTSGWTSSSGQYYYQHSISGITSSSVIMVVPQWSNQSSQQSSWNNLTNIQSYNGYVRFYASAVPTTSINYTLLYY